ncbi:NAD(P)H dehydrogenase [Frankia sp. R43]|uniref:NAD(P)H:quinone oxidoreductase n=1 Tax=Frankia sp. R43 TaxID=269536 RepID=UPI0006CA042D|nr:NAD(P)H:quinone oxidoreductase [Frankia sp. R43]KPM53669.1 NAD(P)H dehydrogenase [Frankia sp. R43]
MGALVKVSIIYYSATGHVAEIAREMAESATKAGADVRLRRVGELAPQAAVETRPERAFDAEMTADVRVAKADDVATADDLIWADAVLMGSPTRFGNVSAQLKHFLDTLGGAWQRGLLADKVYSGFTSTGTLHGGHESTLLALATTFHHFGGIVVAPGYTHPAKFTDGNPYGTSHHDAGGAQPVDDVTRAAARIQAERVVGVARSIGAARAAA